MLYKILGITFKTHFKHFKHVYRTCLEKARRGFHWEGEYCFPNYKRNSQARTGVVVGPQCLTKYNMCIQKKTCFEYAEKQNRKSARTYAVPDKGN